MIRAGRDGLVKWDPTGVGGATAVALASIKSFTLSLATEKINVTCFQDTNRVYIPGMRDISGTLTGFWNSEDMSLVEATALTAPGWLELIPHSSDPDALTPHAFKGLAYMDAELDTDVEGAPALSGTFMAAGPWTLPTGTTTALGLPPRRGRDAEDREAEDRDRDRAAA
jgi:hypothetical protein